MLVETVDQITLPGYRVLSQLRGWAPVVHCYVEQYHFLGRLVPRILLNIISSEMVRGASVDETSLRV